MNCPVTDWDCIPERQYTLRLELWFLYLARGLPELCPAVLYQVWLSGRTAKDMSDVRANQVYQEGLTSLHNTLCMLHISVLIAGHAGHTNHADHAHRNAQNM